MASCELSTTPPTATTWIGNDSAAPIQLGSGAQSDTLMDPSFFSYANGTSLVAYNGQGGLMGGYTFGTDTSMSPLSSFTLETGKVGFIIATVPTLQDDGFVMFAASLAPDMSSASLWSGSVPITDLPSLATKPTSLLTRYLVVPTASALTNVAAFQNPTSDGSFIYGAGATFSSNAVNVSWFERDGTPLAIEESAYTTSTYTVIAAGAAPLGAPKVAVVWVEHDGASPPIFQVRAQIMNCFKN